MNDKHSRVWINALETEDPLMCGWSPGPPPRPSPRSIADSQMGWGTRRAALHIQGGAAGWRGTLVVRGDGGVGGSGRALVPLAGVFLTEHLLPDPKVTSHLQVEAAVCARVALRVAEAIVHDAHGLRAERRRTQSDAKTNKHTPFYFVNVHD